MKKTLAVAGATLLLVCCGGGAALYFFAGTTTYARPADVCKVTEDVRGFGALGSTVSYRKPKDVTAFGRTYGGCDVVYTSGRTVTVVIDVAEYEAEARAHFDGARQDAGRGATVSDVDDVGTKAFGFTGTAFGSATYELAFYDANVFIGLTMTADGVAEHHARNMLAAVGRAVMKALEEASGGSGWDD